MGRVPAAPWPCRPGARLTIASTPVGRNNGKHSASAGLGMKLTQRAVSARTHPPAGLELAGRMHLGPFG